MSFHSARFATEKQSHPLPAERDFLGAVEGEQMLSEDQVEFIERLREAAKEHGAVSDLLDLLDECLLIDDLGNKSVHADGIELAMLKAAMQAASFARYDRRGEVE